MSHVYHESLPGYVPDALFHTGCPECEERAESGTSALRWMDQERLQRAFDRAREYDRHGCRFPEDEPSDRILLDPLEPVFLQQIHNVACAIAQLPGGAGEPPPRLPLLQLWARYHAGLETPASEEQRDHELVQLLGVKTKDEAEAFWELAVEEARRFLGSVMGDLVPDAQPGMAVGVPEWLLAGTASCWAHGAFTGLSAGAGRLPGLEMPA